MAFSARSPVGDEPELLEGPARRLPLDFERKAWRHGRHSAARNGHGVDLRALPCGHTSADLDSDGFCPHGWREVICTDADGLITRRTLLPPMDWQDAKHWETA